MYCNGACCFCSLPCTKEISGKQEKISLNDTVIKKSLTTENLGTYEVKRNLFGKEKVKKVKNESRTLGIEYTP